MGTSSNTKFIHLIRPQNTLWINNESPPQCKPCIFHVSPEKPRDLSSWVSAHWIIDFFNRRRDIMPGFVHISSVCADAQDFCACFPEFFMKLCSLFKFCRTDKCEICRIENYNQPLSFEI